MTHEHVPDDVWFIILQFLKPTDILNCITVEKRVYDLLFEERSKDYNQQTLWKHLCHTVFADNSILEKRRRLEKINNKHQIEKEIKDKIDEERRAIRRIERKIREQWRIENHISEDDDDEAYNYYSTDEDDNLNYYYSKEGIKNGIFDKYNFTINQLEQKKTNLLDFDYSNLISSIFDWKIMFSRMLQRREEWKDDPTVKRTRQSQRVDTKPPFNPDITRLVVCGNGRKDLFINKFIRALKLQVDEYDVAVSELSQVIHLKNVPICKDMDESPWQDIRSEETVTTPSVLLYTVDAPFHYAKQFRGSCLVQGVIYVVDTESFAENYESVYRDLHDIIGECHEMDLFCWVVATEAENYEFISDISSWTSTNYGNGLSIPVINHDTAGIVSAFANILRLEHTFTCHWYRSAFCAASNTADEDLFQTCAGFLKRMQMRGAKKKTGYSYPYSSDEEDTASINK